MAQSRSGRPRSDSLVSEDVRRHNLALVARYLAEAGPAARSEIATGTGLSRASVTGLTALLLDTGLFAEGETERRTEPTARKGRRFQRLSLSAASVALVVMMIDADHVTVVMSDLMGKELARFARSHGRPIGDPAPVLDLAAQLVDQAIVCADSLARNVVDVTVVAFAPVGGAPEIVVADSDLGWGPVDVVAELRMRSARLRSDVLPGRVHLVADVLVAAAAEFAVLDDVTEGLYIKSDSGIGGAALTRGTLLRGAHGTAGAFGHVTVVPDGDVCVCGQRGCLVTVAGPDIVLHRAGLDAVIAEEGLTAAVARFVDLVEGGDDDAASAWREAVGWVGRTLGILALAFDPSVIVVGGYWASLVADIDAAFQANRPAIDGAPLLAIRIVAGVHGADAALYGALSEARTRLLGDPLSIN